MAFAASPSFRLSDPSDLPSDLFQGFSPAFVCRKKIVTLDVRESGCGNSPNSVRRPYVKGRYCAVSVWLYGRSVCSMNRTQNNVIRSEMGPTVEEPPMVGEPFSPKAEVSQQGGDISLGENLDASDTSITPLPHDNVSGVGDSSDDSGGDGLFPPGGVGGHGRGGSGGDDSGKEGGNDGEDNEFGPILKFEEVMKEAEARGVNLPSDMFEAAQTVGIRKVFLDNYLSLQELAWPLGAAIRWWPLLRNRMLADRQFLFKIGTEIVIDSCCATFAEVKKRGKDFWAEFELFTADLLVGLVVNVALVALLAPYARIGQPSTSKGLFNRMAHAYGALPSSVFEAERPGCRFTVQQRFGTYFYKGVLYGAVGFICGLIGQGIANMIMTIKRSVKKSEEDVPVPPLVKSAALWGVFLAVSSNTRYQIVNGLERIVESSPLAKRVPPVAMAFTVGVRFANNVYGGMQFVDWARWSGCQ